MPGDRSLIRRARPRGLVAAATILVVVAGAGCTGPAPLAGAPTTGHRTAGLQTYRTPHAVAFAADTASGSRVLSLLAFGRSAVRAVLPTWHGTLTAYAPSTDAQFQELTGSAQGSQAGIAAVTTTVHGDPRDRTAPEAIVLNPGVMPGLSRLSARVVMAHEAVHAATRAAAVPMPLWLAEGFADAVAIRAVGLSLPVAAADALTAARRDGVPKTLPTDADFGAGADSLEAVYERAWLAATLIARRYGWPRLVRLYTYVESHPHQQDRGFTQVLGIGRAAFTVGWRAFVASWAHLPDPAGG